MAASLDQAEDLERRAKEAEGIAAKAAETYETALHRLWDCASRGAHDELDQLRREADEARAAAMEAARRAAKARAIADAAQLAIPEQYRAVKQEPAIERPELPDNA